MNRFLLSLLLLFWFSYPVRSQHTASIAPDRPKLGDKITITYMPASKTARFSDPDDLTAHVLIMRSQDSPVLRELAMERKGKIWTVSTALDDPKARVLLVQFVSRDTVDNNGERVWMSMVYGKDKRPMKDANLLRAMLLRSGDYYDFLYPRDLEAAKKALAAERKLYPANGAAYASLWSIQLRDDPGDDTRKRIASEIDKLYTQYGDDEEFVSATVSMLEQAGQKDRAREIRASFIAKDPRGKIARSTRRSEVYAERDKGKMLDLLDAYLTDFPDDEAMKRNAASMKINVYLEQKEYDKATDVAATGTPLNGNLFNTMAWHCIEKGVELERATEWAMRGIDILRNPDPAGKPAYVSTKQWNDQNDFSLGMVLDTYATGLFKLGRHHDALPSFHEAYRKTNAKNGEINERFMACCIANREHELAMQVATDCLRKGTATDSMLVQFRIAYVAMRGSDEGFDETVRDAREFARREMRARLMRERLDKPSIDFDLKDLDGNRVRLSGLKGKVVVIDFWATWCGPCKASFPSLQTMYEKYRDDERVKILALDTWESEKGAAREKLVRNFISDNKYTFPVLLDDNVVEKYGVTGIPTKFVIDREGRIQFRSIGFSGGREMIEELTMEIDLLLEEEFYSEERG